MFGKRKKWGGDDVEFLRIPLESEKEIKDIEIKGKIIYFVCDSVKKILKNKKTSKNKEKK